MNKFKLSLALFAAYALLEAIGELTIETGEPQE